MLKYNKDKRHLQHNQMDNIEIDLHTIQQKLASIIKDLANALSGTFPEYTYLWNKWSGDITEGDLEELMTHISSVFPQRFFDILYKNADIFLPTSDIDTVFIPGVDFKLLYNCEGVSDNTKDVLWSYLQLILFTIIGSVKNKDDFGDISSLFEGIHENDLHSKMEEAFGGLEEFFSKMEETGPLDDTTDGNTDNINSGAGTEDKECDDAGMDGFFDNIPNIPGMPGIANMAKNMAKGFDFKKMRENMPNMDKMKDHLKTVFEGKIGKMATELAEEISTDINTEFGDAADVKTSADVIKKIIKNPKKMMDIIKKVGGKIGDKIKSGELSKDDIMKEATDIMGKMKEMGGGEQFEAMLKTMAKQMGGHVNMGAMHTEMKKNSMKEKLRARMEKKKQMMDMQMAIVNAVQNEKQAPAQGSVFKIAGETQEKSTLQSHKAAQQQKDAELDALVSQLNIPADNHLSKKKSKASKK